MRVRRAGPRWAQPRRCRRLLRLLLLTSAKAGTGPIRVVRVAKRGGPGEAGVRCTAPQPEPGEVCPRCLSSPGLRVVGVAGSSAASGGGRRQRRRRLGRRRWLRAASGASHRPGINTPRRGCRPLPRRASGAAPGSVHDAGAFAGGPQGSGVRARPGGPGEAAAGAGVARGRGPPGPGRREVAGYFFFLSCGGRREWRRGEGRLRSFSRSQGCAPTFPAEAPKFFGARVLSPPRRVPSSLFSSLAFRALYSLCLIWASF